MDQDIIFETILPKYRKVVKACFAKQNSFYPSRQKENECFMAVLNCTCHVTDVITSFILTVIFQL